jgi:hemerythrin-like domain-containing protein
MKSDAAILLSELRQDHRNMAVLLNLLQEEIRRVEGDEQPDYELLLDIMRYMTVYSDAIHHPKEDLIYTGLRTDQPSLADGLERVVDDHEELAELGGQLRSDIESIVAGTAIPLHRVLDDTRSYVHRLRQHMAWEEEDLFRRADAKADVLDIDASHLIATDPVFGADREASFSNLLQVIEQEAETAH